MTTPAPPDLATLPDLLTVPELAQLLRISRNAAYSAVSRNEIPGVVRIGRTVRVSKDAVLAWLDTGKGRS